MNLLESFVLSVVQGISEFLPISSSGHLNIFQATFGISPSLTLDIFLNTATLFSVIFYFRSQIRFFLINTPQIIVGTIPASLVGFFLKDQIDQIFSDIGILPLFFVFTSIFVYSTRFLKGNSQKISLKQAFVIGLFQALAILPGVSRSGSTIFAGLLVGLNPLSAFNFSFALFIPASVGALILGLGDFIKQDFIQFNLLIAFITTFFIGLFSLSFLKNLVKHHQLWYFGVYTLVLAVLIFAKLY